MAKDILKGEQLKQKIYITYMKRLFHRIIETERESNWFIFISETKALGIYIYG